MFLGRYILGDTVPLHVGAVDGNGAPAEPDAAPIAFVNSDSAQVATFKLPICDRYGVTGWFHYPLVLDARFAAGHYRVAYQWAISGTRYGGVATFEAVAGGQPDGPGLALFFYRRPSANYLILQTDGGRIVRRRNPRVP